MALRKTALRASFGTAALAALALTVPACGSGAWPLGASGTGSGSDSAYQKVVDDAPVAAASQILPGSLMARIKARGSLLVGGTDTATLFSLRDPVSGQLTGFDAALAEMLAKYITGAPDINLVQVTSNTREALLENGTVDTVFATYTITPARAKEVGFAGPYYSSGDSILVRRDNTSIKTAADLRDKTVCTQSGSTAATDVRQFAPTARVVLFDQNSECEQAVVDGRADAYVLDQSVLLGDAYRDTGVKVVGQPFTSEPYGIGLPIDAPEMKSFVDKWLATIESDGEWAKLWEVTIGTVLGGDAPKPPAIGAAGS